MDGDGTVELLIFTVGFYMADITEYVYRYSEEKNGFELEFAYAGGCDYYEHGVIKASPLHSMYSDYQDGFGLIPYISMMKTKRSLWRK